jgi:glutamate 5-kinase
METKLSAAEIATAAGVTTILTSSKAPGNIFSIIEYRNRLNSPTLRETLSGTASPTMSLSPHPDSPSQIPRPPHTVFTPSLNRLSDRKSWTSHTLHPAGSVTIDTGAHHVLSRRESGGRLLPAGVLGVQGVFAPGQAVRILIRRRTENAPSPDAEALRTPHTSNLASAPSHGLSTSSAMVGFRDIVGSLGTVQALTNAKSMVVEPDGECDQNLIEIGRGLANYSSEQISKVKGLNRCNCSLIVSSPSSSVGCTVYTCRSCWQMLTRSMWSKTSLSEWLLEESVAVSLLYRWRGDPCSHWEVQKDIINSRSFCASLNGGRAVLSRKS